MVTARISRPPKSGNASAAGTSVSFQRGTSHLSSRLFIVPSSTKVWIATLKASSISGSSCLTAIADSPLVNNDSSAPPPTIFSAGACMST